MQTCITPSQAPAVSVESAKLALRIDGDASDADLEDLIAAASAQAEHETGLTLMPQTWRIELDDWPGSGEIPLERTPVASLSSVEYWDGGQWVEVQSAARALVRVGEHSWVVRPALGGSWPALGEGLGARCRVTVVCGFADASKVPEAIKRWIIMSAGFMLRNPDAVDQSDGADGVPRVALLRPYKVY